MTSLKQIAANRANARKSTGPVTEQGKQRTCCNAVRHGLTAETVINADEDAEDYKAFEGAPSLPTTLRNGHQDLCRQQSGISDMNPLFLVRREKRQSNNKSQHAPVLQRPSLESPNPPSKAFARRALESRQKRI